MTETNSDNDGRSYGRLIAIGVFLAVMITAMWTLPLDQWLDSAQRWTADHPLQGRLYYVLAFIVGACIMVPGSVLFMSGGYLFGFAWGAALAALATPVAATAAYFIGATVARRQVASLVERNDKFLAIDKAIDRKGGLIVLLTRLSLVIPYNVLNYAYSVTRVKPLTYFVATAIGMLPPVILFAYVGSIAKNIDELMAGDQFGGAWGRILLVAGVVALIAAVYIIQRTASRILKESIDEASADTN